MKLLTCWCLFGLLAFSSSASGQTERKGHNGDYIKLDVVEVHVAPANVGGGTLITSTNPKPRVGDTKAEDFLDLDPRVGDTLVIHGKYVLTTREKARISLVLSSPKGKAPAVFFPLPSLDVQKGSGDFKLTYFLNREGFLSIGFFSTPENKRFYETVMTPILPMWTGILGPEKELTETPSSATPRSR